jgi:hypothetical protein
LPDVPGIDIRARALIDGFREYFTRGFVSTEIIEGRGGHDVSLKESHHRHPIVAVLLAGWASLWPGIQQTANSILREVGRYMAGIAYFGVPEKAGESQPSDRQFYAGMRLYIPSGGMPYYGRGSPTTTTTHATQ